MDRNLLVSDELKIIDEIEAEINKKVFIQVNQNNRIKGKGIPRSFYYF